MPAVERPPPDTVVWELTLACNARCRYCGSAAGRARADELTTEEALAVCNALHALGVGRVSLMGGEPLCRSDWPLIAHRLAELGQEFELISNGLLFTPEVAARLRELSPYGVSFSLDGPPEVHDGLRQHPGSFLAVARAVDHAQSAGLPVGIITQLNRENLPHLDAIRDIVDEWQVDGWQLQLTSPLGAARGTDCAIAPADVAWLHDWACRQQRDGGLHFYFADDIGYFHPEEPRLRSGRARADQCWLGCQAGIATLGIASDGGVRGCMSLPESFTEGNLRTRSLESLWSDPTLYAYNRVGHELYGDCAVCEFGRVCRGGCSSSSFALTGRLGDMTHCWYRLRGRDQARSRSGRR